MAGPSTYAGSAHARRGRRQAVSVEQGGDGCDSSRSAAALQAGRLAGKQVGSTAVQLCTACHVHCPLYLPTPVAFSPSSPASVHGDASLVAALALLLTC